MTAVTETLSEPVIIDGLPADQYHADHTTISSSGLRALLNPGCPAQFKYDRDNPQPAKKTFDLGHAAHQLVLGDGPELVVVEGDRWDTKAAKIEVAEIRARGAIPLKQHEMDQVQGMADAIRRHPHAGPLFTPGTGISERSIYWTDPDTGIRCRCRPDWLKQLPELTLCVDYKGLALVTPLPTPAGWTTMGDVQVGDQLFDSAGRPCTVTQKSAVHYRRCYRVRFDDASSVICDDEHLWVTTTGREKRSTAVRTTEEIRQTLKNRGQNQHRIPVAGPLDLPPVELPINPYVLGCWLGDGTAADGRITKPDEELFELIAACGYEIGKPIGRAEKCRSRTIYGLRPQLRQAGLLGHKMIPAEYMRAADHQRLALLRGLMDTDGSWNATRQHAVFSSTDKALAMAVRELACSLGQRAVLHTITQHGYGLTVEAYQVTFRPIHGLNPFSLSRKASKVQVRSEVRSRQRIVVAVEEVPTVPTQCIAVDSPDRTYLCTEAMVPTHNTTTDASPAAISKAIEKFNYHQQDAFYTDGIEAARLAAPGSARFVFVFQSKTAPYLITVRELSEADRQIGRAKNQRALRIYAECVRTDTWPDWTGPVTDIPEISLPAWAATREAKEYLS